MANANNTQQRGIIKYTAGNQEISLSPAIVQQLLTTNPEVPLTQPEVMAFMSTCKAYGLNPFIREAYIVKYSEKSPAAIVVGRAAIEKRAEASPQYDGREDGIITLNKQSGELCYREGLFYLADREELVGGWATVYRKDQTHPIKVTVRFQEAAQYKSDGKLNSMWSKQPATMINKVAVVRALRQAFPGLTGGMYDENEIKEKNDDELPIIDPETVVEAETKPVTPQEISIDEL